MDSSAIVGTTLDYVIIVLYFVVIFGFGAMFARFTRSTKDFFFGGQRFSWWLISFSCIATTVGSYSFIKYSAAGFRYGMASSMSYLNDWIEMGFFLLIWFPIIYFARVSSIPEYFQRRFDGKTRTMATIIIMTYMIGYIGINLYTMGVALGALLGTPVFLSAVAVAVVCAVYVTAGGQTSVIMTDLLQGVLLLIAGFALLFLGLHSLGGLDAVWNLLPEGWRLPLADFNAPPKFSFVGVFWQDGIANNIAFYFMNQGLILRFLSLKSTREAPKALIFILLVLMPLAAIAVGNAGWLGRAMVGAGLLPADTDPNRIFVVVAEILCTPGVFGLIMAALIAALMSTIDTLINAVSVVAVNDIYRPYIAKGRSDRHYLGAARVFSLAAGAIGIVLVPLFASFKSIYVAHGAFIATVTPPMVVAILLGVFWKRFTTPAAFWTLLGGAIAVGLSVAFPQLIAPLAHGVDPSGGYKYMRALYGIVAAGIIGIVVTAFTKPKAIEELQGLVAGTIAEARRRYKGAEPRESTGRKALGILERIEGARLLKLSKPEMERIGAAPGDLLYVADARRWLGGLRSIHATAAEPHLGDRNTIQVTQDLIDEGELLVHRPHRVELIM